MTLQVQTKTKKILSVRLKLENNRIISSNIKLKNIKKLTYHDDFVQTRLAFRQELDEYHLPAIYT